MSTNNKEPQSFAMVLEDADHGRIDRILSSDLAEIVDQCTSKANLHDAEWDGEMTIKIKVKAEPNGKVALHFNTTKKIKREPLPKARMYYDPDTRMLVNDAPKQVKIPGVSDRPMKSAKAPGGES